MFHESANIKTNLQEKEIVPKVDKFQLEVEQSLGHNSQDILDEATDQGDNFSSPSSQKTPSGSDHDKASPSNRSVD